MTRAETCLRALEALMGDGPWLAGSGVTLADLHAAPMFAYFRRTDEGARLLSRHDSIQQWWNLIAGRPSMAATRFPIEEAA
jgi:glutathione S-transferase